MGHHMIWDGHSSHASLPHEINGSFRGTGVVQGPLYLAQPVLVLCEFPSLLGLAFTGLLSTYELELSVLAPFDFVKETRSGEARSPCSTAGPRERRGSTASCFRANDPSAPGKIALLDLGTTSDGLAQSSS